MTTVAQLKKWNRDIYNTLQSGLNVHTEQGVYFPRQFVEALQVQLKANNAEILRRRSQKRSK
jgi:hypothetical protein